MKSNEMDYDVVEKLHCVHHPMFQRLLGANVDLIEETYNHDELNLLTWEVL